MNKLFVVLKFYSAIAVFLGFFFSILSGAESTALIGLVPILAYFALSFYLKKD